MSATTASSERCARSRRGMGLLRLRAPRGPYQREGRTHVDLDSPAAARRFARIPRMSSPRPARSSSPRRRQPRPLGRRRPREGRGDGGAARDRLLQQRSPRGTSRATSSSTSPRPATTRSTHYDLLKERSARRRRHGLRFKYPNGVFTSRTSVATLGQALETAFLGTYLGAVGSFKSNALKSLAGQIAATESRHLGVLTNIAAGAIVPAPDLPRVYTGAQALPRSSRSWLHRRSSVACIPSCLWFAMLHQSR